MFSRSMLQRQLTTCGRRHHAAVFLSGQRFSTLRRTTVCDYPRFGVGNTLKGGMHGVQRRFFMDKVLIGASASALTCSTTLAVFHLIVTPLSASIAAMTLALAAISGSMTIIDGGGAKTTQLGALFGFVVGVVGGFYAKSQQEPWRK